MRLIPVQNIVFKRQNMINRFFYLFMAIPIRDCKQEKGEEMWKHVGRKWESFIRSLRFTLKLQIEINVITKTVVDLSVSPSPWFQHDQTSRETEKKPFSPIQLPTHRTSTQIPINQIILKMTEGVLSKKIKDDGWKDAVVPADVSSLQNSG